MKHIDMFMHTDGYMLASQRKRIYAEVRLLREIIAQCDPKTNGGGRLNKEHEIRKVFGCRTRTVRNNLSKCRHVPEPEWDDRLPPTIYPLVASLHRQHRQVVYEAWIETNSRTNIGMSESEMAQLIARLAQAEQQVDQ